MLELGEHTATQVSRICAMEDNDDALRVSMHTSQYQPDGPVFTDFLVEIGDDDVTTVIMLTEGQMEQLRDDLDEVLDDEDVSDEACLRELIVNAEFIARVEQAYHDDAQIPTTFGLGYALAGKLAAEYDLFACFTASGVELRFDTLFHTGTYMTISRNNGQGMHADAVMSRQGARYIVQIMEAPSEQAVDTAGTPATDRQHAEDAMLQRVQERVNK